MAAGRAKNIGMARICPRSGVKIGRVAELGLFMSG
jgi:hypothetical protein